MLKYINKMNSIHWLLLMITAFTLMSLGKVVAVIGIIVAGVAVLVKFWSSVTTVFNKLFRGEK